MAALDSMEKIHHLKDDRWTIRDKLTQYRGLVNLYIRDRATLLTDTQKTRKKNLRELRQLTKDVLYYRNTLTNAKSGDRQRLRNALQNHRGYLLAYENRLPVQVIENVFQLNFNKRKLLDRLSSKLKTRMKRLLELQLEAENLQFRVHEEATTINPRRGEQVVHNKIETMKTKTSAALLIKFSYEKILALLKKDALYFNRVLLYLNGDQQAQMKCVLQATEMGQVATEDLANLRQAYKTFEKEVKASMKMRDKQVRKMREEVENVFNESKNLMRTESETDVTKCNIVPTPSEIALPIEIGELEETIKKVQDVTLVPTFDDIFPQMQEQMRQKNRLLMQLNALKASHDELISRRNNEELMLATLQANMGDDVKRYRDEKRRLLSEIGAEVIKRDSNRKETKRLGMLLTSIRASAQTLYKLLDRVQDPEDDEDDESDSLNLAESSLVFAPPPMEENAETLMEMISEKLKNLKVQIFYPMDEAETARARALTEKQIVEAQIEGLFADVDMYDQPLIVEHEIEDPLVMTRDAIKARSTKIVEQFCKPLEMTAVPKLAKLKKKKGKWM